MTESSSTALTIDQTITISKIDYERFLQLHATDTASHASTSGTRALLASRDSSWIIDSEASSYMWGARDLFTRLSNLSNIHFIAIY